MTDKQKEYQRENKEPERIYVKEGDSMLKNLREKGTPIEDFDGEVDLEVYIRK